MISDFEHQYRRLRLGLLESTPVDVGHWHSMPTGGNKLLVTMEVPHVSIVFPVPATMEELQTDLRPNLPWAEEHFLERIGGEPVNPPPSHELWPWAHAQHQEGEEQIFSHTYPERMWPKKISGAGIRETFGDLDDVAELLVNNIYTRQAYLPIWFPEDTGGGDRLNGARVPCTLGYHFMVRNGVMDLTYYMRSCDFVRHFRDDAYMAARLLQWMVHKVNWERMPPKEDDRIIAGNVRWHIASLHAMEGDRRKLNWEVDKDG